VAVAEKTVGLGQFISSLKFWVVGNLSENLLLIEKFLSKNAKFKAKN